MIHPLRLIALISVLLTYGFFIGYYGVEIVVYVNKMDEISGFVLAICYIINIFVINWVIKEI